MESGRARFLDMVRLELWNGLGREDAERFLAELESLVETLPTTSEVWHAARRLARQARTAGLTAQPADLLVFAAAKVHAAGLLHRDAHFDALSTLGERGG